MTGAREVAYETLRAVHESDAYANLLLPVRLVQRAEAMDAEVGRLEERETADSVDGAIATLDEEETRLLRQRDRKWVLAQLIRTS